MIKNNKFKQTEIGSIPEDWDIKKIDDIKSKKLHSMAMGPFGSNITKDNFVSSGVPVIRGGNLTSEKFNESDFVFISEAKADSLKSSNASPKDIVITHRGTLGQVGIIPVNGKYNRYVVSQSQMKLRCDESIANPDFVFYFLRSPQGQYLLLKNTSTTGVPSIAQPLTTLKNILIPFPSLNEQHAIASILCSLDDKIALNHSMNSTLEAIGQALFARWFVDFEFPDGEGKPYRSSGGEMVETELGEVPKGWRVGTLGELCDIIMGQSPPGTTYNEIGDGLPFYQGITDFGFRFPNRRVYCTAPTRFAEEGNVLLSVRAPVGSLNVADERCAIGRGVATLRLKGKQHGYLYYLLCATQSGWNKFEAEGTVFGSVNKADVNDFKVILPPETLRNKFGSLMEPLDKQIMNNEKQSRTLAALRDALLPKLMSGKIRIKVYESEVAQ